MTDAVGSSESGNNGHHHGASRGDRHASGPTVTSLGGTVVFDEDLEAGQARLGRDRKDRPFRRHPRRLLQRPREDGRGLHHGRRQALRHARRLRHRRGRRVGDACSAAARSASTRAARRSSPRRSRPSSAPTPTSWTPSWWAPPTSASARRVAAIVEPRHGHDAPSLEAVQEHCRGHVAGYKVPRQLHVVDKIERSRAGSPTTGGPTPSSVRRAPKA